MNSAKRSLLSKAIRALRLDLVRFLVVDCEVKILQTDIVLWDCLCFVQDREWCQVRDDFSCVLICLGSNMEKAV